LINLSGYPEWIFFGISVYGLIYLRNTKPDLPRPFKTNIISSWIFVIVSALITIIPFIPPSKPTIQDIPYYLYPLIGILLILVFIPWWYFALEYNRPDITLNRSLSQDHLTESNEIPLTPIK
jgi:amino acid transporter